MDVRALLKLTILIIINGNSHSLIVYAMPYLYYEITNERTFLFFEHDIINLTFICRCVSITHVYETRNVQCQSRNIVALVLNKSDNNLV